MIDCLLSFIIHCLPSRASFFTAFILFIFSEQIKRIENVFIYSLFGMNSFFLIVFVIHQLDRRKSFILFFFLLLKLVLSGWIFDVIQILPLQ